MPERLSTILNVSEDDLNKKGVFNSFIDIDCNLYIDPCLLESLRIKEFKNSYENFRSHFSNIITVVEKIKQKNDMFYLQALKKLQFKEFRFVGLGYSKGNKKGNGIGKVLAEKMLDIAIEIVKEGIKDPIIFELIGLIQKNISLDRISDMTTHIIKKDLIEYTARISKELNIETKRFGRTFKAELPFNPYNQEPIIFIPKKILRDIPMAFCWEDIDLVGNQIESLKDDVNNIIGKSWKDVILNNKNFVKNILLENPEAFKDLIKQYKTKPRIEYDFLNDPIGEIIWAELSEKAATENPINFKELNLFPASNENMANIVKTICDQFSHLIENCGWYEFLYNEKDKLRNERFAQKLFYGIADCHCRANNLNLSREPNAGSGAIDFKITQGYDSVVTVEIKYSSNTSLVKGYKTQLPTYNKAENAKHSIYLVIRTTESQNNLQNLEKERKKMIDNREITPEIIVIDGRKKLSASKRKN